VKAAAAYHAVGAHRLAARREQYKGGGRHPRKSGTHWQAISTRRLSERPASVAT
jgi:hypothetical protein